MTPNRVIVATERYYRDIPAEKIPMFQTYLKEASDECMDEFMYFPIKKRSTTLLLSIFLGGLGADRFYIGDTGIGAAKLIFRIVTVVLSMFPSIALLTAMLSFVTTIWCFADIFLTYKGTKEINYNGLTSFLIQNKGNGL